jgi:hypothetical protein
MILHQSSDAAGLLDQEAPADIRLFLTQCSIQSFMFLLAQTRDLHTIKWLDTFTRPTTGPFGEGCKDYDQIDFYNDASFSTQKEDAPAFIANDKKLSSRMLYYHGLSALNTTIFPTWESYFRLLLEEPVEEIVVETNNHLVREFTIDINPASLCSRILSVRDQIAKEWVGDLDVIARMGGQIFYSYWDNIEKERESQEWRVKEKDEKDESPSTRGGESKWVPVPPLASQDRSAGLERQSLSFLEWDPNEYMEHAPSPLRQGNFDLLILLATQESVRRIVSGGTVGVEDTASDRGGVDFLRTFYLERRASIFNRGSSRYGRADDFLEELMLSSPRMVTSEEKGKPVLIDPLRIAEVVVLERERVAKEWIEVAKTSPEEHTEIRKLQLNRMMGL